MSLDLENRGENQHEAYWKRLEQLRKQHAEQEKNLRQYLESSKPRTDTYRWANPDQMTWQRGARGAQDMTRINPHPAMGDQRMEMSPKYYYWTQQRTRPISGSMSDFQPYRSTPQNYPVGK